MNPEEIWNSYSSKLKAYIMKHIPNKYETEVVLQEVSVRIQKNANKYSLIEDINVYSL